MTDTPGAAASSAEAGAGAAPLVPISYGDFGARFFDEAVTIERIQAAVGDLAGKGIKIGPVNLAGGLAGFVAEGAVGEPTITRHEGEKVAFDLHVPAALGVVLRLGQEIKVEVAIEVNLVLHARAARPLRIVVDIPQIGPKDVHIAIRAEALGAAWQWLLEPMGEVIRGEVANRINSMTSDAESVRGRVFDIAARIEETKEDTSTNFKWMTYEEFGTEFFRACLTEARIASSVADLDGREIAIGPLKAGPKDMAEVRATGVVSKPRVTRRGGGENVVLDVVVPLTLDLIVAVRKENHYTANIEIPLVLTGKPTDFLNVYVEVASPSADDIKVDLKARGIGASMLNMVGGIKGQIAAQVAEVVAEETADPSGRIVDIAERINAPEDEAPAEAAAAAAE